MVFWNEKGLDRPDLLSGGAYILVLTTYTIEPNSTTVLLTVQNIGIAFSQLKVIAPNILFLVFDTALLRQIIHFPDQMMERRSESSSISEVSYHQWTVLP